MKRIRLKLMTLAFRTYRWLEPEDFKAQRLRAKWRRERSLRTKPPKQECGISRVGKFDTTFRGKPRMVYEKTVRVTTDREGHGHAELSRWRVLGSVTEVETPLSWYAVGDERYVLGFDSRLT